MALSIDRKKDHLQQRLENFHKFLISYHEDEIILSQALAPWQVFQAVPSEAFKEHKADMKKIKSISQLLVYNFLCFYFRNVNLSSIIELQRKGKSEVN